MKYGFNPSVVLCAVPSLVLLVMILQCSAVPGGVTTSAVGDTAVGGAGVSAAVGGAPDDGQRRRPHETVLPEVPAEASFCGERVPLERLDVYECFDREIISNTFLHSATLLNIKRSGRFFPIIEPILKECGVPDDMKYLCVAESNLNPTAKSPAGAAGPWQFLEGTAKEFGLKVNEELDERNDVAKSTRAACKFLKASYRALGTWTMVAASYNGGLGRVRKNMEQQQQQSYYDVHWAEETRRYVFRILAIKEILSRPADFGFDVGEGDKYRPYKTEKVSVRGPIADVPQWAIDHGTTYRLVRMLNPWILKPKITRPDSLVIEVASPEKLGD